MVVLTILVKLDSILVKGIVVIMFVVRNAQMVIKKVVVVVSVKKVEEKFLQIQI
jgi:hypothetical protein